MPPRRRSNSPRKSGTRKSGTRKHSKQYRSTGTRSSFHVQDGTVKCTLRIGSGDDDPTNGLYIDYYRTRTSKPTTNLTLKQGYTIIDNRVMKDLSDVSQDNFWEPVIDARELGIEDVGTYRLTESSGKYYVDVTVYAYEAPSWTNNTLHVSSRGYPSKKLLIREHDVGDVKLQLRNIPNAKIDLEYTFVVQQRGGSSNYYFKVLPVGIHMGDRIDIGLRGPIWRPIRDSPKENLVIHITRSDGTKERKTYTFRPDDAEVCKNLLRNTQTSRIQITEKPSMITRVIRALSPR